MASAGVNLLCLCWFCLVTVTVTVKGASTMELIFWFCFVVGLQSRFGLVFLRFRRATFAASAGYLLHREDLDPIA